jgi:hypothetical protein
MKLILLLMSKNNLNLSKLFSKVLNNILDTHRLQWNTVLEASHSRLLEENELAYMS